MAARGTTPTPIRKGNVRRFPATERGRQALLARRAAFYVLPPSDGGTVSEWRSWGSSEVRCVSCAKLSHARLHLVLMSPHGMYTFLRRCDECGRIHAEWCLARQEVIAAGRHLRGWCRVPDGQGLYQRKLDELEQRQVAAPRPGMPRWLGGDRGA